MRSDVRNVVRSLCVLATLTALSSHPLAAQSLLVDHPSRRACHVSGGGWLFPLPAAPQLADDIPRTRLLTARFSSTPIPIGVRQTSTPTVKERNWIRRHPVLFGALVGYTAGFVIGYAPGDDAVFDDFTAGFNGFVLGGVGAAAGALIGAIVGK